MFAVVSRMPKKKQKTKIKRKAKRDVGGKSFNDTSVSPPARQRVKRLLRPSLLVWELLIGVIS